MSRKVAVLVIAVVLSLSIIKSDAGGFDTGCLKIEDKCLDCGYLVQNIHGRLIRQTCIQVGCVKQCGFKVEVQPPLTTD